MDKILSRENNGSLGAKPRIEVCQTTIPQVIQTIGVGPQANGGR